MVIKTLRWKKRGFNRLADYIAKEDRDEDETFRVLHNLRPSNNLNEIARQYFANDAYRKQRANGVTVYHEIMSFARGEEISLDALEDLTREYIELRAPNALVFAAPHFDKEHIHVHLMISGTEFESSKTLRLNNAEFKRVHEEIERYQVAHYPELKSVVYIKKERSRIDELEAIQEARALRDRAHEEPMIQEEPPPSEVSEVQGLEAARIQELEAIQEEQRQRGQERGLGTN